jgi:hypothetical protein
MHPEHVEQVQRDDEEDVRDILDESIEQIVIEGKRRGEQVHACRDDETDHPEQHVKAADGRVGLIFGTELDEDEQEDRDTNDEQYSPYPDDVRLNCRCHKTFWMGDPEKEKQPNLTEKSNREGIKFDEYTSHEIFYHVVFRAIRFNCVGTKMINLPTLLGPK